MSLAGGRLAIQYRLKYERQDTLYCSHAAELERRGSVKNVSAIVLMELWAGARTKKAERLLSQLQRPYESADRIVTLSSEQYISAGQFFSDLAPEHRELCKRSDFVNDVRIALYFI